MKPGNWNELTDRMKRSEASKLLRSGRGQYIVGQALAIAARELRKVKGTHAQPSNIEDMEALGEMLFPSGWYVETAKANEPEEER